jgi:hypothetical protein
MPLKTEATISPLETYTPGQRMIAAAVRLRDAWEQPELDITELHQAVIALIVATQTRDLESALDVLHGAES